MQQYAWRGLSQGFWDSPHPFAQALGKGLREIHLKESAIPQYIDVVLTCRPSMASDQLKSLIFLGLVVTESLRKRHKLQSNKVSIWDILETLNIDRYLQMKDKLY